MESRRSSIFKTREFDSVTKLPTKRDGKVAVVIAVQQRRAVPVPKLQLALDVASYPNFKRLVQVRHVPSAHPNGEGAVLTDALIPLFNGLIIDVTVNIDVDARKIIESESVSSVTEAREKVPF